MNFVSCKLIGGLGNNLFQISTSYAYGLNYNKIFFCDINDITYPHNPIINYQNNIFRHINFRNITEEYETLKENVFEFSMLPDRNNNVKLDGFFQNYQYFDKYTEEIMSLFKIKLSLSLKLKLKYISIDFSNCCSIHVRRGDYLNHSEYHPVLDINYYLKAIEIIGSEKMYLIFSDDINWCKNNFTFLKNKKYIHGNKDYEDLYLMSFCKNNIIANSTFSWWGAWLNSNVDKNIIAPKHWFGPKYKNFKTDYLYLPEWIQI